MRKSTRESSGPGSPCLVVTYGNTSRKHRPLDADVMVFGRQASCDVSLMSPEVAPIHCVLARVAEGWKLRDCSGRNGTRVNGKVVHEVMLCDSDVLQIGSFSFEVKLPPVESAKREESAPAVSPSRVQRYERSRKRLVELALRLRKRLGNRQLAVTDSEEHLVAQRSELNQQAAMLQSRQKDYDLRITRVELSERDLATDRATLDKEYRAFQEDMERHASNVRVFNEHVERVEQELQQKRDAMQDEVRKLREEAAQRAVDRSCDETTTEDRQRSRQKARELEARASELDQYARHLRKLYQSASPGATASGMLVNDGASASMTASLQVHQDALTGIAGGLRVQLAQATALVDQLKKTLDDSRGRDSGAIPRDSASRRRLTAKKV